MFSIDGVGGVGVEVSSVVFANNKNIGLIFIASYVYQGERRVRERVKPSNTEFLALKPKLRRKIFSYI